MKIEFFNKFDPPVPVKEKKKKKNAALFFFIEIIQNEVVHLKWPTTETNVTLYIRLLQQIKYNCHVAAIDMLLLGRQ